MAANESTDTPEGSGPRAGVLATVVVCVALAALFAWWKSRGTTPAPPATPAANVAATAAPRASDAHLRFSARTGDVTTDLDVTDAAGARILSARSCETPSLESWLDGRPPARLVLDGAAIQVGADTRFLAAIGAMFCADEASLAIHGSQIEVTDGATVTARLAEVECSLDRSPDGAAHLRFSAASDAGAIAFEFTRTRDATTASCDSKGLALERLQPLVAALFPGARVLGAGDLAFQFACGPGPRLSLSGTTQLDRFAIIDQNGAPIAADSDIRLAGKAEIDLAAPLVRLERFKLLSSFCFADGDGSLGRAGSAFAGDLAVHFGANFERATQNAAATTRRLAALLGIEHAIGSLDVRVNPGDPGAVHVSVSGERVAFSTHGVAWPLGAEITLDAETVIDAAFDRIDVKKFFGSFAFGDISGSGKWLGGDRFETAFSVEGEMKHLASFLLRVLGGTGLTVGGEGKLDVGVKHGDAGFSATAKLEGDDLGMRFDRMVQGGGELYVFEGAPLRLRAECAAPALGADLAEWTGKLSVKTPRVTFGVDAFDDFALEASLGGGKVRVSRATAAVTGGGKLEGTAEIAVGGPDRGLAAAKLTARDVVPRYTLLQFAAAVAPIFAPAGGPPLLATDSRMTAEIDVSGRGDGLDAIRASLSGTGHASFSSGTITGSPLLDQLLPGPAGPRPIDRAESSFRFDRGIIRVDPVRVVTGGRELTLTGSTAKDGSFGFTLPATDLFDSAFLAEHGRNWPHDLFGVRGAIDAPHVRVPNVEEWRRLAAEGGAALEKAVHEFGGP